MPDIMHTFPIRAPILAVFEAIATPQGLDQWWTSNSTGTPLLNSEFELGFGPEHQWWRARVVDVEAPHLFVLEVTTGDPDWTGTRIVFELEEAAEATRLRFSHRGWRAITDHYAITSYCWAMYLRILRRYVEHAEMVPYPQRLDV